MHRRITNNLKMVDAYQALAGVTASQRQRQATAGQAIQQQQQNAPPQPAAQHQQQVQQPANGTPAVGQQQQPQQGPARQARFNHQVQAAVHNAMQSFQQVLLQQQANMSGGQAAAGGGGANVNFAQQRVARPPFPGLDERGPSWHVCSALLECHRNPCTSPFCQGCALHGHTVDQCKKLDYNAPGVNKSGYWCEQKPGCAPLRAPRPPAMANVAVQSAPFPTPYVMNVGGQMQQQQQQQNGSQHANGGGGHVNHAAPHAQHQSQQQPPAQDGAGGKQ
jgi:hypothetical protein